MSQGLALKGDFLGYGLSGGFTRSMEGKAHAPQFDPYGRVIPGTGKSIPDMLKNEKWKFQPGILTDSSGKCLDGCVSH